MEDRIMIEQDAAENNTKEHKTTAEIEKNNTKLTFSRLECIFAYVLLGLGFCFIQFVFWNTTGFFTTVFFLCTASICMLYLKKSHFSMNKNSIITFSLLIIFSMVFSISANDFIKFLNTIFILVLGIYWVYGVCKDNNTIGHFFFFDLIKSVFIMPFSGFAKAPKAITYTSKKSQSYKNVKLALVGLVITIPVTVLVASLLTSADSGVERMLDLFYGRFQEKVFLFILKLCMGIPVAFYIFGLLYANVRKEKAEVFSEEQCEEKLKKLRISPNLVLYSAVTPICFLYILFFISQLQYFLSAFMGELPEQYSFSEYARRGFFELCAIAVINLAIILAINIFSKNTGKDKPVALKGYSIIIAIFTIMIIVTALSKMIMYIGEYGLTQLRLYTSWFMLLLALAFLWIILKQVKTSFNFEKYLVLSFVFMFAILCFSNMDGIIAKYNITMYKAGYLKELDVNALCNLSDDGLVYVLEEGIDTEDFLNYRVDDYIYNFYPFRKFNISSLRVDAFLEKDSTIIKSVN